ncbi:hypothetical protein [Calycomorphotria hydatis]|uniref:hypothetical protein n=1 Tax=Calycomorphotria hydatis TaxID=2528027 RepID=UPI0011A3377F|nr:hypothetical protein [Calycomorphotria hydatis]
MCRWLTTCTVANAKFRLFRNGSAYPAPTPYGVAGMMPGRNDLMNCPRIGHSPHVKVAHQQEQPPPTKIVFGYSKTTLASAEADIGKD